MGSTSAIPKQLKFTSITAGEWEDELDKLVDLDAMNCTKSALGKMSLPLKACFFPSKVVYMQFDGSSYEGNAMGRFMILDIDGVENIQSGQYYGTRCTNNVSDSFAIQDAL